MAVKKSRAQLQSESDSSFPDNTTGAIVPENHRIYNDNVNESFANLKDANTYDEQNTFTGRLQVDGLAYFTNTTRMEDKFIQNQVADPIASDMLVNLNNVEGNIIFISGTTTINGFQGNVGHIFYATFQDGALLNCDNGASIQPNQNIQMNGGDTLIFVFTTTQQIRVLGLRRFGGDFFVLNALKDMQDLIDNASLQIGAYYLITQGYDIFGGLADIMFFAKSNSEFDYRNVKIGYGEKGFYYLGEADKADGTDVSSKFKFRTNVGQGSLFSLTNLTTDQLISPQFGSGSSASLQEASFYGAVLFDYSEKPILKNIQNILTNGNAEIGRFVTDPNDNVAKFFAHSGNGFSGGWGYNPIGFADGVDNTNLQYFNAVTQGLNITIANVYATYQVVNDIVTINFKVEGTARFNDGNSGHEMILYFPLPFEQTSFYASNGFGSVRNVTDVNNSPDMGAIIGNDGEPWYCILSAKSGNAINSNKSVVICGTYSYISLTSLP